MKVIPKKTFLLRQDDVDGKKKDVIAHKGVAIEVTDKEAAAFFGYFIFGENEKKKLMMAARVPNNQLRRIV